MILDTVNGHHRLTLSPETALSIIRDLSSHIGLAQRSVHGAAPGFTMGLIEHKGLRSFPSQITFCVQSPAMEKR